ncbi:MAG: glycosyltransferase family 9 protein [Candidatus Hydrogenedentes bacterium]|nr:glycosyltransferase family 9 protein [Candidatus Hydrogenedentota bacterium]
MKRILVFQTARMGDMVQTSPLIAALKRKYPGVHLTAMVRRMGKAVAERHPDVDEVIVYDEEAMFRDLRSQDSDRLLRAYENAERYIERLRAGNFDAVYNCTNSIASAMLLKLAGIKTVVGAHLSDDWQFVLRGAWVNYFFTNVLHREFNDLNLCDIFLHFLENPPAPARLRFQVEEEDTAFVSTLFEEHQLRSEDFIVCFQLGASEDHKRWLEPNFAALARLLIQQYQARILLLGVKEEARFGAVFKQHAPGMAIPLFGQTTLPELAAVLERARMLITNDTGTMHVAAAVGCPVMLVSIGYVHFRETGPYGEGHCAIERRQERIGHAGSVSGKGTAESQIRPEQVFEGVKFMLARNFSEARSQTSSTVDMNDVDVYMSRFASDGCLQWYPVLPRPLAESEFLRMVYRAMWLDHLSGGKDVDKEEAGLRAILDCYRAPAFDRREISASLNQTFDQLAELAERGMMTTRELLEGLGGKMSMRRAKECVAELSRLDEETRIFGEVHPACKPLVVISRFERDNLEGADPLALARTTDQIYRDLRARARLMQQKLGRAVTVLGTR